MRRMNPWPGMMLCQCLTIMCFALAAKTEHWYFVIPLIGTGLYFMDLYAYFKVRGQ